MKVRTLLAFLFAASALLLLVSCGLEAPPSQTKAVTPNYTELGSHTVNDCLVIEVATDSQDEESRAAIADRVIADHNWNRMVRVFFYVPGQTPGNDVPAHRIERNSYDGRDGSY
jgi:hypothetical protein